MNSQDYKRSPLLVLTMFLFTLVSLYRIVALITMSLLSERILALIGYLSNYLDLYVLFIPFNIPLLLRVALNIAVILFGLYLAYACVVKLKKSTFKAFYIYMAVLTFVRLIPRIMDIFYYFKMSYPFNFLIPGMIQYVITWVLITILYKFEINASSFVDGRYRPKKLIEESRNEHE